jgi:hypothetical protein
MSGGSGNCDKPLSPPRRRARGNPKGDPDRLLDRRAKAGAGPGCPFLSRGPLRNRPPCLPQTDPALTQTPDGSLPCNPPPTRPSVPSSSHLVAVQTWPEAFARWIAERTGGPVPRFEEVEPGDEQILEDPEQRDLDAGPSFQALRDDEDASGEPEPP